MYTCFVFYYLVNYLALIASSQFWVYYYIRDCLRRGVFLARVLEPNLYSQSI